MKTPSTPSAALTLDLLPEHTQAVIQRVRDADSDQAGLQRRLLELGFVPGERVQVLRRPLAGRGPLAVRVGGSTFAMRPLESSLIEVLPG
jgi:ferrous iron transport protein A